MQQNQAGRPSSFNRGRVNRRRARSRRWSLRAERRSFHLYPALWLDERLSDSSALQLGQRPASLRMKSNAPCLPSTSAMTKLNGMSDSSLRHCSHPAIFDSAVQMVAGSTETNSMPGLARSSSPSKPLCRPTDSLARRSQDVFCPTRPSIGVVS